MVRVRGIGDALGEGGVCGLNLPEDKVRTKYGHPVRGSSANGWRLFSKAAQEKDADREEGRKMSGLANALLDERTKYDFRVLDRVNLNCEKSEDHRLAKNRNFVGGRRPPRIRISFPGR